MSGIKGKKDARFDLLPMDAIWLLAVLYGKNDKNAGGKYDERNWEKGYEWSLSYAAAGRHLALAMMGEDSDSESGLPHELHAAWHLLALVSYRMRGIGIDDRTADREGIKNMKANLLNPEVFDTNIYYGYENGVYVQSKRKEKE